LKERDSKDISVREWLKACSNWERIERAVIFTVNLVCGRSSSNWERIESLDSLFDRLLECLGSNWERIERTAYHEPDAKAILSRALQQLGKN
jgi:hypothetical protein